MCHLAPGDTIEQQIALGVLLDRLASIYYSNDMGPLGIMLRKLRLHLSFSRARSSVVPAG